MQLWSLARISINHDSFHFVEHDRLPDQVLSVGKGEQLKQSPSNARAIPPRQESDHRPTREGSDASDTGQEDSKQRPGANKGQSWTDFLRADGGAQSDGLVQHDPTGGGGSDCAPLPGQYLCRMLQGYGSPGWK